MDMQTSDTPLEGASDFYVSQHMVTPEADFLNSKMFTLILPIDLHVNRKEGAEMGTVARPQEGEYEE